MTSPHIFSSDMETDFSSTDSIKDPLYELPSTSKGKKRKRDDSHVVTKKNHKDFNEKFLFTNGFFDDPIHVSNDVSTKITTSAKCCACDVVIKTSSAVTSNFITHLRRKHPSLYNSYIGEKPGRLRGRNSDRQIRFEDKLVKFIIDTASPVSIIEKKSFIDLFKGTGLKVISRKTLMAKMDQKYDKMVSTIKGSLQTAGNFCTTADIWSTKNRSFLGYTCHWLEDTFQRKSVALACQRFAGVHSAQRIAPMLAEINNTFQLNSSNIVATVTDNGSNFVKAFKDFGVRVPLAICDNSDSDTDMEELTPQLENTGVYLPRHIRCASHTLNLLATTDFITILSNNDELYQRHLQVFKKCNTLWKKCSWPKSSEIIKRELGTALIVPVATRWNSLFDAISRLLLHENKLDRVCEALGIPRIPSNDVRYLHEYKKVMFPISSTLDFLQGEKNTLYGCLIPSLVTLSVKLKRMTCEDELESLKPAALLLEEKLRDRFAKYFLLSPEANEAVAASVLCPDIKMRWFQSLSKTLSDHSEQDIHNLVINLIEKAVPINEDCTDFVNTTSNFDFYDFEDDSQTVTQQCPETIHTSKIGLQFFQYLNDAGTDFHILSKYPILKKASLRYNTPLTSSAPVERLFSFAGVINRPRRQSLSDYSLEKLVVMKANLGLL